MTPCWSYLCDVDVSALAAWLAEGPTGWSTPPCETKPQRIFCPPQSLTWPVVAAVFACLQPGHKGKLAPDLMMLSRMRPGQSHGLHHDNQHSHWVTRVHVPIVTNPAAWILFEEEGERVHFEQGKAYSFDTYRRHAFGNDGTTDRVHLLFDVLEV